MRTYYQQNFRVLPSTQPLKSPSPDLKSKNIIMPTNSPNQFNMKKSFALTNHTPPKSKKKTYFEYSTLPNPYQENLNVKNNRQNFAQLFQKAQKNLHHNNLPSYQQKQYSSTHAKTYNPIQDHPSYYHQQASQPSLYPQSIIFQHNRSDLMQTGKKSFSPSLSHYTNQKTKRNVKQQQLQRSIQQYRKSIEQKDVILSQLKEMINLMTENGKHLKNSQSTMIREDYENMKKEIKILTIENQKLLDIIDKNNEKMSTGGNNFKNVNHNTTKNQHLNHHPKFNLSDYPQQSDYKNAGLKYNQSEVQSQIQKLNNIQSEKQISSKFTQYQHEISQLKQKLQQKQCLYEKQIDQLIKSHKSLAMECKMYQTQKQRFSKQNQRLINLLKLKEKQKETCYNNYSYIDKSQKKGLITNKQLGAEGSTAFGSSDFPTAKKQYHSGATQTSSNSKLSLQKIKAQYQQNLKQYQQNVQNQIQAIVDTMNSTIQELNQKLNAYQQKIAMLENFKNYYFNKNHHKEESHTSSVQVYNIEQDDGSIKKSAIYIQQAPSSQRISTKKSRQALSIILEQSRRDNQKLELQLSQLRIQVQQYKQRIMKMQNKTFDNTKRSSSSSHQKKQQNEQIQSYVQRIKKLQNLVIELRQQKQAKEKQLIQFQCQILKNQQNRLMQKQLEQLHQRISSQQIAQPIISQDYIPSKIQSSKTLVINLTSQINYLKAQVQSKDEQMQKMRQMMDDMEKALDVRQKQLYGEIQNLQTLIKQTQQVFNQNKKETSERIQQLERQSENLHQKIDILEEENFKLNKRLNVTEKLKLEKKSSQTSLQSKIKKLSQTLAQLKQSKQQEIEQLNVQNNKFKQQSQSLQSQLQRKQTEIQTLMQKISSMRQNLRKLLNLVGQQFKSQNIALQSIQLQTIQLQQNASTIQNINQSTSQQNKTLLKNINSLKGQLYQSQRQKLQLTQRIQFLQKSIQIYKQELQQRNKFSQSLLNKSQASKSLFQSSLIIKQKKTNKNNRIREIVQDQKNKINSLVKLIKKIEDQERSIAIRGQQLQQE